jgi:hypothetical protein
MQCPLASIGEQHSLDLLPVKLTGDELFACPLHKCIVAVEKGKVLLA